MKKGKIAFLAIIIIIVAVIIIIKNNVSTSQIEYNIAKIENYKYVIYKENEKMGIMDREGNIVIKANYSEIKVPNPEKDIFICYNNSGKTTVLNASNQALFTNYSKVEPIKIKNIASTLCFEKSVLQYEKDGKYGLIDFEGKEITGADYKSIENLQSTEGKMLVCKDDKYGVINIKGTILVEPKYDKIATDEYYSEETKYVDAGFITSNTTENGYRYGYIDSTGKEILKPEYNDIIRISEQKEIYLIAAKNGQYGLYKGSTQLIKPEYQSITYTENGAIILERNEQYGIANLSGEIKVQPKYSQIEENGIYLYAQNERENTVYDSEANKVDINFNKAIYKTEKEEYRIITILNNNITYYGIESKEGKSLVSPDYTYIEYIYGDYFIAQNNKEKYGVINANGKAQIEFGDNLIQRIKDKELIQISSKKSENIKIYSSKLEEVASVKNARIDNKTNYVKIYNDKETIYLDNKGNKIEETYEIVQKELQGELPNEIKGYKIVRNSLEEAYYE